MSMTGDHNFETRRGGIEIELVEIVENVDGYTVQLHGFSDGQLS